MSTGKEENGTVLEKADHEEKPIATVPPDSSGGAEENPLEKLNMMEEGPEYEAWQEETLDSVSTNGAEVMAKENGVVESSRQEATGGSTEYLSRTTTKGMPLIIK